jgi:uncharacterized membrane protein YhhN
LVSIEMELALPLSLIIASIDWFSVATKRLRLELLAKPAVIIVLGVWLIAERGNPAFGAGLALSLLGDVSLLPPNPRLRYGLAAFLGAHIAYTIALNGRGLVMSLSSGGIALVIAVVIIAVARYVLSHLGESNLRRPIIAYTTILGVMTWSAWSALFRPELTSEGAWLLAAGGTLFFVSDSALAINRFVRPLPGGRLFEHVTYHLAQISLTAGILIA